MRILIADGDPERHEFFKRVYGSLDDVLIQAYSFEEAELEILSTPYKFDLMYLEYSLPTNRLNKDGLSLASLITSELKPARCINMKIYCHSMDLEGRHKMVSLLRKNGFNVIDSPFLTMFS